MRWQLESTRHLSVDAQSMPLFYSDQEYAGTAVESLQELNHGKAVLSPYSCSGVTTDKRCPGRPGF